MVALASPLAAAETATPAAAFSFSDPPRPATPPTQDPWASAAWLDTWWECIGAASGGQRYRLPMTSGATALELVATSRHGLRRLHGAGGDSQRHDLACAPGDWPALAHRLVAARDWDWLELLQVPEPTARGWGAALAAAGAHVICDHSTGQRYLPLNRPWEAIQADWSAALRHRLPRQERALLRLGARLECHTRPAHVAAAFERCLEVEASGWKGRQGTAMLSRPAMAAFYRRLVVRLAECGLVQLRVLACGADVIAFDLDLITPHGLAGLKTGMAEKWKRTAPGLVLQYWVLRAAHEEGFGEYDFLGADDAFKRDWTPHTRSLCRLQAFAPTLRGCALPALRRSRAGVRRLVTTPRAWLYQMRTRSPGAK